MTLVFDTETTGLANFAKDPSHPSQPKPVQIAAVLYDDKRIVRNSMNMIVKPDGWTVPEDATKVHGISSEMAECFGLPENIALGVFAHLLVKADRIVAHNYKYDNLVMLSAGLRHMHKYEFPESFCTMEAMTGICKLPGYNGKYKWPKLEEAYAFAFGEPPKKAHDALADVESCARLYWWIKDGMPSQAIDEPIAAVGSIPSETHDSSGQPRRYEPAFTDDDKMPFGKHKGLPMCDVPATYLGWLWADGCTNVLVKNYIWNSRNGLNEEIENPDHKIVRYK